MLLPDLATGSSMRWFPPPLPFAENLTGVICFGALSRMGHRLTVYLTARCARLGTQANSSLCHSHRL
jgi:hypothetical protein